MKSKLIRFCALVMVLTLTSFVNTSMNDGFHTLTVKITNIRNNKGRIQLQLYKNQTSFKAEKAWRTKYYEKNEVLNGVLVVSIPWLPTDTYGVAILDDENRDGKMGYSWLMPTEGFGFSDFYLKGMSGPHFNDFKFLLNNKKTVTCKLRYL